MSIFNPRTWGKAEAQAIAPAQSPFFEAKDRSWDEILRILYSNQVVSGESVTPNNAMRCTTVHAIMRALTNAIGSYPVGVFRELDDEDGKTTLEPIADHRLMPLLRKPNKHQTQSQFFRQVMLHIGLWGNHVSIKGQGRGPDSQVLFLRPVHPDRVRMVDDDELNPVYAVDFNSGPREYNARQVLHVTGGITVAGAWADSPVKRAQEAIGLALVAERMMGEYFGNSGLPSVVLTGGKFKDEEQYDMWVRKWKAAYGRGGNEAGGTAMLPDGMTIEQLVFKAVEAQVLETRKFQRTEIASVWGVPPHKLADLERATFANIEHQDLEFLQDVMLPYARLIEQPLERDLLTEEERADRQVIRFDLDGAVRADFKSRVAGYKDLYNVGAMNPNQIRAREGMRPRTDPGGEAYGPPANISGSSGGGQSDPSNAASDTGGDASQ